MRGGDWRRPSRQLMAQLSLVCRPGRRTWASGVATPLPPLAALSYSWRCALLRRGLGASLLPRFRRHPCHFCHRQAAHQRHRKSPCARWGPSHTLGPLCMSRPRAGLLPVSGCRERWCSVLQCCGGVATGCISTESRVIMAEMHTCCTLASLPAVVPYPGQLRPFVASRAFMFCLSRSWRHSWRPAEGARLSRDGRGAGRGRRAHQVGGRQHRGGAAGRCAGPRRLRDW